MYVSGGQPAGSSASVVTTAIASGTGSGLWSAGTGLSGNRGQVMGVAATGSAVIVNARLTNAAGAGDGHIVTIGYDTGTGAKTWTASYYGQTQSYAYTIGISPDGSQIFVGGTITLAYSTS